MSDPAILSIHYLPCQAWFTQYLRHDHVLLDRHEHFVKQTYRNRCVILSANGPLALTIPVRKKQHHMPMFSVEIQNEQPWQRQHWQAIRSAYGSAPYFEHYAGTFEKIYGREYTFLHEFNIELIRVCLALLRVDKQLVLTTKYHETGAPDLREMFNPGKAAEHNNQRYLQVFAAKFPFVPNLSVVDLLFNQGPAGLSLLGRD